jgi:hypothetical protein
VNGLTAANELQDRIGAAETVERELLEGLALAVIAETLEVRLLLAVLRW